nr:aminoglycoside resistance protein [Propionibacterium sp.]
MTVPLPPALNARRALGAPWAAWLDGLPRLVDDLLLRWHLTPDGPPLAGHTALVVPVLDADGVRRALKVGFREEDNASEIPALQLWAGRHAVRLLRADPRRGALLLEWLGDRLALHPDADVSTRIVAELYGPLHRPAAPQLPELHPLVNRWLDTLEALGRTLPAPPRLVDQALTAGRRLAAAPGTHVLHGDLHDLNVMGRADSWVAIDPKGYNGDPCFEPAPLLWNRWATLEASGNIGQAIRERFYAIVDTAGLDERRARDWVVVRTMVNVAWQVIDGDAGGGPAGTPHAWITRNITIAKAMQAVAAP